MTTTLIAGGVDQSVLVQIYNEDGTEKTDLAYNTAGLVCYYTRGPAGTPAAITLATQTSTGTHSDGGFVAKDATNMPGLYRLDVPDALAASGVNRAWVTFSGVAGVGVCTLEIDLPAYDPYAAPASTVTLADGGITAAKIASDAITAAKIASDAITEIQNGLATSAALAIVDTNVDDIETAVASLATAANLAIVDQNVDDIETAVASLATAANLALLDGKVDTIDSNVDTALLGIDAIDTNVDTLLTADVAYKKNTAVAKFAFYMADTAGDPGTGLTVTVQVSKDGGAFSTVAGSVVEIANGWYYVPLTATELNADEVAFKATATGAAQRNLKIRTQS